MSMVTLELDSLVPVTNQNDLRDHFPLQDAFLDCRAGVGQEASKLFGILSFGQASMRLVGLLLGKLCSLARDIAGEEASQE